MYSKDEQDIYYEYKFLLAVMFDDNYDYYKRNLWFYDIDVLEIFKDIVKCYSERGCISDRVKDNIYKILVDARNIKDENYNERIMLINEIIGVLNSQKEDNSLQYYIGQILLRKRKTTHELKKYNLEDLYDEIPSIHESIFSDFMVLLSHSEQISDEQFVERYLSEFSKDKLYYESLNVILKECPSLFQNKLFIDRMNAVFELNREMYRDGKKLNKQIIKSIKKKGF